MLNKLINKYIIENDLEKLWQLAFHYEEKVDLNKIMSFYIKKRNAYYVCELICIVIEFLDLNDIFKNIIETKDKKFMLDILNNGPIQGLIESKYLFRIRDEVEKSNEKGRSFIMEHKMNLHNEPFELIKNGTKTIELRLNDEKRQLLKENDIIEFTNRATKEVIKTKIVKLYNFNNFDELYKNFDKISMGYKTNEVANSKDMEKYYSKEEQDKYGVLAIEIVLV